MFYNFDTTYTKLDSNLFQLVDAQNPKDSNIILLNESLLQDLDLKKPNNAKQLLEVTEKEKPFAQSYAGHQFGYFTILGDGRAMILGEHITKDKKRFDIQLKGSGMTQFSRGGDGKATESSMLREYMYSYAMNALNISTSRSLAVIATNEKVQREDIQDGAILIRVMKSHIRFGTFEYIAKYCSENTLKKFADYVISRHYPEVENNTDKYLSFFRAVMKKTIEMVINWYRVGFIHGVMNTDNMSITGETFDYGPCAFMNQYDKHATFSQIDTYKRYSFGNQRNILKWNLGVFAETLVPLLGEAKKIIAELDQFDEIFDTAFYDMMKGKLGITDSHSHKELIDKVLEFMQTYQLDYTNTFIELMYPHSFNVPAYNSEEFITLREQLQKIGLDSEVMKKHNPQRILRNYLVEDALEEYKEHKDLRKIKAILNAISKPYEQDSACKDFQKPPSKTFDKEYRTHCNT